MIKQSLISLAIMVNFLGFCYAKEQKLTTYKSQELYILGKNERIEGNYKKALSYLRAAIKKDPQNSDINFELSLAHLACGNLAKGFNLLHNVTYNPDAFENPWNGESLKGKTVFVNAAWGGLGDTLMLMRYVQQLKVRGAHHIILQVFKPLLTLLSYCPYIDYLIGYDYIENDQNMYRTIFNYYSSNNVNNDFSINISLSDFQINLISLPHFLKTSIKNIPTMPYLTADPKLVQQWQTKLQSNNFKIGICWQGAQRTDLQLMKRSVPLKSLAPLLTIPGIEIYNLQKGCEEEITGLDPACSLLCFDKDFDIKNGSFMDTAAVMRNLDLVITIDTAIAHLAGGLGVPVWVMLPHSADWRYHIDRSDSPWYPSMRLFRQPTPGDWKTVIEEMVATLNNIIN